MSMRSPARASTRLRRPSPSLSSSPSLTPLALASPLVGGVLSWNSTLFGMPSPSASPSAGVSGLSAYWAHQRSGMPSALESLSNGRLADGAFPPPAVPSAPAGAEAEREPPEPADPPDPPGSETVVPPIVTVPAVSGPEPPMTTGVPRIAASPGPPPPAPALSRNRARTSPARAARPTPSPSGPNDGAVLKLFVTGASSAPQARIVAIRPADTAPANRRSRAWGPRREGASCPLVL